MNEASFIAVRGQLEKQGTGNGTGMGTGSGNGNEKREREIVLGSSPRFPNEYVTSQGRLGTRLL